MVGEGKFMKFSPELSKRKIVEPLSCRFFLNVSIIDFSQALKFFSPSLSLVQ